MPSPLMKSVSGIRGIVGESLTPPLVTRISSAFGKYVRGGTVVIGMDTRPTGQAISFGAISALAQTGCDVIDVGVVPTPTVQVMVEELGAAGGIVISASHNPIPWNAFKLIGKSGTFLTSSEIKKFFAIMDEEPSYQKWNRVGSITADDSAFSVHVKKVISVINRRKIRKNHFRVVLDSVNGAGSLITRDLLQELGCNVIPIHCDPDGRFPRGAEPVPTNLKDLSAAVRKHRADIGFAQDPDADRLAIVDETGNPIGEEYTLALVTEHLLSKEPGSVVTNLSTTKAIDDIATGHGSKTFRTKVGEINVVEKMKKINARIGGEGNGGVISPEVHLGRDSLAGIGYILDMVAERKGTVSEIVSDLPFYVMKKGKVSLEAGADGKLLEKCAKNFAGEKISKLDGLRIDFTRNDTFAGGWVHLRASNTEPVFRIITEGSDSAQASRIYRHFSDLILSS